MSTMPGDILVGAVEYKVMESAEYIGEARQTFGDHRCAETNKRKTTITLDPSLSESRKRETLIHECIHALLYEWNVDLGQLAEEPLVESLGNAVLALIRDNPPLIEYVR